VFIFDAILVDGGGGADNLKEKQTERPNEK
jgi:hypothetical protein